MEANYLQLLDCETEQNVFYNVHHINHSLPGRYSLVLMISLINQETPDQFYALNNCVRETVYLLKSANRPLCAELLVY